MTPSRKKSLLYYAAAFLMGVVIFSLFFSAAVPFLISVGAILLAAIGFHYCFNRGYETWNGDVDR